jgi:hypothetical protein
VLNGVFWRTRSGSPGRDLPSEYGNWKTVYNRHRRWSGAGTWVWILDGPWRDADRHEGRGWTVGVDAGVVRAHHHAAGARHQPLSDMAAEVVATTVLDTGGPVESQEIRPITRVTTAGHRHDSLAFEPVMAGIRIRRRGRGRPRTRPAQVLGDKAYSSRAIRSHPRRRRITATIPEPADQRTNRLRRGSKRSARGSSRARAASSARSGQPGRDVVI